MESSSQPPRFDGNSLDIEWLRATLAASETDTVSCRPLDDVGGMISQLYKIVWTVTTSDGDAGPARHYVFKQITTEAKRATSAVLGYAREVQFYRDKLSDEIASLMAAANGGAKEASARLIPTCVYAHANAATGEKYLLLEDLGEGTSSPDWFAFSLLGIQCGFFYGPGSPNNWAQKDNIATLCAPYAERGTKLIDSIDSHLGVDMYTVTKEAFSVAARLHAKYWKNKELLESSWIRGSDWWQQQGEAAWLAAQQLSISGLGEASQARRSSKDAYLDGLIAASCSKMQFASYCEWTKGAAWTLVHGDFHPSNLMWIKESNSIKFLDWEMIAIGNGCQDIAQYMISHMEPSARHACEQEMLRFYYDELTGHGVSTSEYSFAQCYLDYVRGGSERWMWFLTYMLSGSLDFPDSILDFFCAQVSSFCRDHNVTADSIGQLRP